MAMFRSNRKPAATSRTDSGDGPSRLAIVSAACITLLLTLLLFYGG